MELTPIIQSDNLRNVNLFKTAPSVFEQGNSTQHNSMCAEYFSKCSYVNDTFSINPILQKSYMENYRLIYDTKFAINNLQQSNEAPSNTVTITNAQKEFFQNLEADIELVLVKQERSDEEEFLTTCNFISKTMKNVNNNNNSIVVPQSSQSVVVVVGGKEATYECSFCIKKFVKKYQLTRHERTHCGMKSFSCVKCNKVYKDKGTLEKHLRLHSAVKSYSCMFCNKLFGSRYHKKEHERIHTGVKPYKCSICEKCFSRRNHVVRHEETHSDHHVSRDNNKKTTVATQTRHTPPQQISLQQQNINNSADNSTAITAPSNASSYACSYCFKTFKRKYHKLEHERIHTGERPYACSFCDKSFSRRNHVVRHEETHTKDY